MSGLLLYDIFSLKKMMRTYGMLIAFFAVIGIVSGNSDFFVAFASVYAMTAGLSVLSFREAYNWDVYANTLPVTRAQMVRSLYGVGVISLLVGVAIGLVIGTANVLIGEMMLADALITVCIVPLVGVLLMSVNIPLILRFGSERGRLIMMGSYAALFLGVTGIANAAGDKIAAFLDGPINGLLLAAGAWAAAIVILLISYAVALSIYKKKEF